MPTTRKTKAWLRRLPSMSRPGRKSRPGKDWSMQSAAVLDQ